MAVTHELLKVEEAELRKRAARMGLTLEQYKRHYIAVDTEAFPHPQSWAVTRVESPAGHNLQASKAHQTVAQTSNPRKIR
jgi:hypothetical protein